MRAQTFLQYIYCVYSWAFNLDEDGKKMCTKRASVDSFICKKHKNAHGKFIFHLDILRWFIHSFIQHGFFYIRRAVSIDFRRFIFFSLLDMRFLCCMHNVVHSSDIAKLSTMWRSPTYTHTHTPFFSVTFYLVLNFHLCFRFFCAHINQQWSRFKWI